MCFLVKALKDEGPKANGNRNVYVVRVFLLRLDRQQFWRMPQSWRRDSNSFTHFEKSNISVIGLRRCISRLFPSCVEFAGASCGFLLHQDEEGHQEDGNR